MFMTVDQLRRLARASVSLEAGERERALAGLGHPSPSDLAEAAAAHLGDADRNVRVAAVRVLALSEGPAAVEAILRALDDPMKRVRSVAAKSCAPFVSDRRIVERLKQAVERDERGSAAPALAVLCGAYRTPYGLAAVEPVPEVLEALVALPRYRRQVLVSLLGARTLSEEAERVLRDFVADGNKEEAVLATRRLCGLRLEHHARLSPEERRRADRAWGDVWFWVRAGDDR
jgi:HEAT repeat protein